MKTNMIELDVVNELCRRLVNKMRLKTALIFCYKYFQFDDPSTYLVSGLYYIWEYFVSGSL